MYFRPTPSVFCGETLGEGSDITTNQRSPTTPTPPSPERAKSATPHHLLPTICPHLTNAFLTPSPRNLLCYIPTSFCLPTLVVHRHTHMYVVVTITHNPSRNTVA